jgi:hypothetical protein
MKTRNWFIILVAALLLSPLTSCVKDQPDVFDEPSSARMEKFLKNVRTILQDPAEGWALSYYPGSSYATCYMGLKFTGQEVAAYAQDEPEEAVTSAYKLCADDGAVLSFDMYNSVIHYYATPDQAHYQARGGDFEFEIMDVKADRITLRGKRSRNFCYLDRLTKNVSEFLSEMNEAESSLDIVAFKGEITGGLVEGFMDSNTHTLSIGRKGAEASEMTSARYMIVPGGFHFNEPFTFQGVTFQDFYYNTETGVLTAAGISFEKVVPEGYLPYDKYLGKWTFYWYNGDRDFPVELVEFEKGSSYKMKGLSEYFEPTLAYDAARGRLTWNSQAVGSSGATTVMLAGWDLLTSGGSLSWGEDYGLIGIVEDNTVADVVVNWEDNGQSDLVVDSWILWGTDASGSSTGAFSSWTMASNSYQLPYITHMKKLVE